MGFPLDLIWLAIPAYIILQFVVIWRSSGPSRRVAALPLVVMVPVLVLTGVEFARESNLWPIWLFFATPPALLYVIVIAFVGPTTKHSRPAA